LLQRRRAAGSALRAASPDNGLTLVTADERLLGVRGLPTLANL
jgi:hypothetical protein